MDFKEVIIAGIIIIIFAMLVSFVFSPASEAHNSEIQVLNKGDFGLNSTVYVKLVDGEKSSLSDKTVHVKLIDSKGKTVYSKDATTHATGVAIAKLSNVSAGEYTLNITFDGDANYTSSSVSKKVTVKGEEVVDEIDNATLIDDTLDDSDNQDAQQQTSQQSYSQPSSSPSSSSSSSSSSDSDDGFEVYIDENGKEMTPVIDENGKQIDPSTLDE